MFLFKASTLCMSLLTGNFLAEITLTEGITGFWRDWYGEKMTDAKIQEMEKEFGWVRQIVEAIKTILVPLLAIVAAAGIIWAIVLGVQMARADSADKRDDAKKRLICLVIAIVIVIVLIVFFLELFPIIMKSMIKINPDGTIGTQTTTGTGTGTGTTGTGA